MSSDDTPRRRRAPCPGSGLSPCGAPHWRPSDSMEMSSEGEEEEEEEFFDAREEMAEGKNAAAILLGMSQWNSNDLVEQIETIEKQMEHSPAGEEAPFCSSVVLQEKQRELYRASLRKHRYPAQGSIEIHEDNEEGSAHPSCTTQVLILVLHGGNLLESGSGEETASSKESDLSTFAAAFEEVARAHFPSATSGRIRLRLVPCPAVCAEAFSLIAHLMPFSEEEGTLGVSEDHLPLAALPLLAISSPEYQGAVATVISRANQVYAQFLRSPEGLGFSGQVCLIGDCVGGILAFDAICFSAGLADESQASSRRGSASSAQDNSLSAEDSNLGEVQRLSKSNNDISEKMDEGEDDQLPRQPLQRKQSGGSTYECDAIAQHHAFLSSIHSTMLDEDFPAEEAPNAADLSLGRFDFEVSDFFLFGSPLGLVLAMRRTVLPCLEDSQVQPACNQVFSLFHSADPSASRLEPLLENKFHRLPPFAVPRYQRHPRGDGRSLLLVDALQAHKDIFVEEEEEEEEEDVNGNVRRRGSNGSTNSVSSGSTESLLPSNVTNIASKWWGSKRIDYALYCPGALTAFPTVALPHLFHASYWESKDVVAFILRQLMRFEEAVSDESHSTDPGAPIPSNPREKWLRRRTQVKLRNVTANHRSNDVIAAEGGPQVLVGRFMYGPLDMVALTGEKVDILVMTEPSSGRWVPFDTEITNSSGRVSYAIPKEKRLPVGVFPIKMVVRGDQSSALSFLTVLPRGMECVVFSIDGSFAASVSIMGSDPKVRAGAVDVVRHWQDLGFLILYITGRPDMQKQRVVSWLSQHNFPQGMIFFSDGLVHDPLRQKAIFLRNLVQECHIKICAAYGSMKDISVYSALGLSPSQIYIVGRPAKKYQAQCQFLSEGYASHLSCLEGSLPARPKKPPCPSSSSSSSSSCSSRLILRKGSFGLPSQPDFLRKRSHLRRTLSVQQPEPPSPAPKPERAQSQPEPHKEHERGGGPLAWGRAPAGVKFEPAP
ncbi:membrane-associated phosphatidylinositol transfer protein 3 [Anolis sagrei]|uniref:membrane-associated phosphatidylinositol transfer protein 3 n=1 Tax=Anolis sagrei TaxID=38937 RepID=UPI003520532B